MSALHDVELIAETAVPGLRGARAAIYALAGLIALVLLGFAIWWIFIHPRQLRAEVAQGRVDTAVANGTANAAAAAIPITVDVLEHRATIDVITGGNERAIHAAAGAEAPSPAVALALRSALCLRDAYRDHPECAAVPQPGGSVGVAGPDTGGGAPAE